MEADLDQWLRRAPGVVVPAFLAVSELWLDTDPPLPLDVDGEIRAHTPARITLAPQALRVMVAPGFDDT